VAGRGLCLPDGDAPGARHEPLGLDDLCHPHNPRSHLRHQEAEGDLAIMGSGLALPLRNVATQDLTP
jgi:hypothetical protein